LNLDLLSAKKMTEIVVNVERMQATRLSVKVLLEAKVEDFRIILQGPSAIAPDRQRIIFKGRVLKNGHTLASYGLTDNCVVHLVEKPLVESATGAAASSAAPATAFNGDSAHRMMQGSANVLFHTMQLDPNATQAEINQEITSSLMNAFGSVFGTFPSPVNNTRATNNTSAASTNTNTGSTRVQSRASGIRTGEGALNSQTLTRTSVEEALNTLNVELQRITRLSDGSPLFPVGQESIAYDESTRVGLFQRNLELFEQTYGMMAMACSFLRNSAASANAIDLPLEHLLNFTALLQQLPLLMVSQRRLMTTLRTRDGTIELPSSLDIPSFFSTRQNSGGEDGGNIDLPE
jgi:hypothetical protein